MPKQKPRKRKVLPMVTCAMAQPFVSVALRHGLDVDGLLEPAGVGLPQVRAGEELMAAQHWYNLMDTVAEQIQTPTLGFQLGRQLALEELPNLRKLRTDHATLGDLLSTLVIEAASLTSLAEYELRIRGRIAHLSSERTFKPSQPPLQGRWLLLWFYCPTGAHMRRHRLAR